MLKLFRRVVYTLIALITILCIAVVFYVRGSLPDYSGEYEVQGIKGPVEIVRDFHAVPHIYADHQDDLAFGMGYVMAEDRLWQMDLFRRVATGMLPILVIILSNTLQNNPSSTYTNATVFPHPL